MADGRGAHGIVDYVPHALPGIGALDEEDDLAFGEEDPETIELR